jgi:hypothetical protein
VKSLRQKVRDIRSDWEWWWLAVPFFFVAVGAYLLFWYPLTGGEMIPQECLAAYKEAKTLEDTVAVDESLVYYQTGRRSTKCGVFRYRQRGQVYIAPDSVVATPDSQVRDE